MNRGRSDDGPLAGMTLPSRGASQMAGISSTPVVKSEIRVPLATEFDANATCVICSNRMELENVAVIVGCAHRYCNPCLFAWSKQRCACPVCAQPYMQVAHSFTRAEGYAVDEVRAETVVDDAPPNSQQLMGLDHEYFLKEVSNMAASVTGLRDSPMLQGASIWHRETRASLREMAMQLDSLYESLVMGEHFDPVMVLETLYAIEAEVRQARLGPQQGGSLGGPELDPHRPIGWRDVAEEYVVDEDDYDEEDYYDEDDGGQW